MTKLKTYFFIISNGLISSFFSKIFYNSRLLHNFEVFNIEGFGTKDIIYCN